MAGSDIYWTVIDVLNALLTGTMLGGYYAAISLGLALPFGVMKQVNLAYGDWLVACAYLIVVLVNVTGLSPIATLIIVVPAMFALGYGIQRLLLNRVSVQAMEQRGLPPTFGVMSPILVTFGLSLIISRGLQFQFGVDVRSIPSSLAYSSIPITADIQVSTLRLIMFGLAVLALEAMRLFITRTHIGRALRATSDDVEVSQLMGMRPASIYAIAGGISMATAAVGGLMVGLSRTFQPFSGPEFLLIAFGVCVIGGVGSMRGILAGGVLLGIVQVMAGTFLTSSSQLIAGYMFILAVLAFSSRGSLAR